MTRYVLVWTALVAALASAGALAAGPPVSRSDGPRSGVSRSAVSQDTVPIRVAEIDGEAGETIHAAFSRYAEYGFSGVVLVERDGRRILHAAYGWADREGRVPLDTPTAFDIQSTTKPIVAALAVKLVAEGVLDLDMEVGSVFPSLDEPHGHITLRRLLSHASGLSRDYSQGGDGALNTRDDAIRVFGGIPLESGAPEFAYRNLNYAAVKAVIEEVTGEAFTEILKREVLDPAGAALAFDPPPGAATGYEGMPGRPERSFDSDNGEAFSGGTLWGSAEALTRWEHALDAGRIVPPNWVDTIRTPVAEPYGLGWFVYPGTGGHMLYHGGDGDGFQSTLVRYPGLGDLYFTVLMNDRAYARDLWWRNIAMKAIQFAVADRELALPPSRSVPGAELDRWTGTYATGAGDSLTVRVDPFDGFLVVEGRGAGAVAALNAPDAEWRSRLARATTRSERIGSLLRVAESPSDSIASAGDWRRFLGFLAEYAPTLVGVSLDRWRVLGSARSSSSSVQTFVAANDLTLRLVWNAETLTLRGWGLGGETPGALAVGIASDAELIGFIPGSDRQVSIRAPAAGPERVESLSIGDSPPFMRIDPP